MTAFYLQLHYVVFTSWTQNNPTMYVCNSAEIYSSYPSCPMHEAAAEAKLTFVLLRIFESHKYEKLPLFRLKSTATASSQKNVLGNPLNLT